MDKINEINKHTILVIAGCNSLNNVGGKLIGDPLERSSFEAINWNVDQNGFI